MSIESKLAAEALQWKEERELPRGPANSDHYVIRQERDGYTIHVRHKGGARESFRGLTQGQANQLRIRLSDAGFIGKVVGAP
jgi:hypothetical protein